MAERLKARAWKVRVPQKGTVGSNPTLSASHTLVRRVSPKRAKASREDRRKFRRFAASGPREVEAENRGDVGLTSLKATRFLRGRVRRFRFVEIGTWSRSWGNARECCANVARSSELALA